MGAGRPTPMASQIGEVAEPYVGPRPYQQAESALFFGRTREVREAASLVVAQQTLLLFGPSGAGKTSMVNAGLIAALQPRFDILPPARVRATANDVVSPQVRNVFVFNVLSHWLEERAGHAQPGQVSMGRYRQRLARPDSPMFVGSPHGGPTPDLTSPEQLQEMTFADYLAMRTPALDEEEIRKPRLVIFDQFEELLLLHPECWEQRPYFFEQVRDALDSDPVLRIVFVIREDQLAPLHRYVPILPGGLRTRYRLELLGREAALEAVTKPVHQAGRYFAEGVAEDLVDDLRTFRMDTGHGKSLSVPGEFIDPVQLQVVCRSLWSRLPSDVVEITRDHRALYGGVDAALSRYYDDAIRAALPGTGMDESSLRKWFATSFVTPMKTRNTVLHTPRRTAGVPNSVIDEFESRHLIRAEYRARARWYELTHDRFIEAVLASNSGFETSRRAGREEPDASQRANQALSSADEALRTGQREQALGFTQEALQLYEEADDPYGQANALGRLAQVFAAMLQFARALQLCDEAVAVYQQLGDEREVARAIVNKSGDSAGSALLLEKVISQFRSQDDLPNLAETEVIMATLQAETDAGKSLELLQAAADHYHQSRRRRDEAATLTQLALLWVRQGDFERSHDLLLRALEGFQEVRDRDGQAVALSNLAMVCEAAGLREDAIRFLRQARRIYRASGNAHDEAELLVRTPQLQDQGADVETAAATYREAVAIWRAVGNKRAEADALSARGQLLAEVGRFQEALEDLSRALDLAVGNEVLRSQALSARGLAYAGLGDHSRALAEFQASLDLAPENAWMYYNRARAYESMGRHDDAVQDYRSALEKRTPPLSSRIRQDAEAALGGDP